nr:MAG TPA: hypothetical protein [Caudoviricetes sp.]
MRKGREIANASKPLISLTKRPLNINTEGKPVSHPSIAP